MASLLHRLGRWCAQHPWRTLTAWIVIIAAAGTSAAVFMKPLTNEFTMPDSRFQTVLEDLKQEIPEAAGAMGPVVFTSEDGFDDAQRQAIATVLEEWRDVDGVADVVDPFATQDDIDAGAEDLKSGTADLDDGQAEIDKGREDLAAGQAEIDAGRAQWESGREQLEANRDQLPADMVAQAEAELDAADQQLTDGQAELDAGRDELDSAQQEIDKGRESLALGQRFSALSDGLRFVNEDNTVALAQVQFDGEATDLDPETGKELQEIGSQLDDAGVGVEYSQVITQDLSSVMGPAEVVGLVVAAVVLLVMLGGLLVAGLPLVMALVGVGVGVGAAMGLTAFVQMNSVTPALALMLGLAVGIDYSLFLINRHRGQLRQGMGVVDSIALANGTSGNAVTFAGLTVIIALAALVVTGVPFLGVMGLVAAGTVVVAVLVAITLTPAILSLLGHRALGRSRGKAKHLDPEEQATPRGWAALVQRHPWLSILGVVAVVAVAAFPVTDLRLGLPDGGSEGAETTAYQAYDLTRENFGAGANGPIVAVATLDEPLAEGETALMTAQVEIGEDLAQVNGTSYVVPFGVSDDRTTLAFQIVPKSGPAEQETVDLVRSLDSAADRIGADNDMELGLTGQTVANIDISQKLADALPIYLLVVVGLSIVLMLLVFRSVLVPLLATAGFLLSIGAAFGVVVAVFQWGVLGSFFGVNDPGPILSFLPILLIGVLFGLAMDYQVFLVTAMREAHVHGEDARRAVVSGFNHSARVVTAAAIIMISVFGGFAFAELMMIRPIGLGLAVGVLVDAFLVRMTLTPAVLSLLGERAWSLPRWLDRLLPEVDVEGAKLERALGVAQGQPTAEPERASASA